VETNGPGLESRDRFFLEKENHSYLLYVSLAVSPLTVKKAYFPEDLTNIFVYGNYYF
jgi:hypothetical protein